MSNNGSSPLVLWYNQLGMNDVDRVGGKNASLGEMITNPFVINERFEKHISAHLSLHI